MSIYLFPVNGFLNARFVLVAVVFVRFIASACQVTIATITVGFVGDAPVTVRIDAVSAVWIDAVSAVWIDAVSTVSHRSYFVTPHVAKAPKNSARAILPFPSVPIVTS